MRVKVNGLNGTVIHIRHDDRGEPIYTVKLDDAFATPTGFYYARSEEIKAL